MVEIAAKNISTNSLSKQPTMVDDRKFIPKEIKDFAKNQEQQFVEYMLQEMQNTVDRNVDEEESSTARDYYESLQLTERAKAMTESGNGIGIQDLILKQVYPKEKRTAFNLDLYNRIREAQNNKLIKRTMSPEAKKADGIDMIGKEANNE